MHKTLTKDALEAHGYRKFKHPFHEREPAFKGFFQKAVRDAEGNRKFHLSLEFWDFGELDPRYTHGVTWDAKVQFHTQDDKVFNMELLHEPEMTLPEIEAFFDKAFLTMGCRNRD